MAKRKTSRQIAASRRNIKKAQIISARKRRGRTVLKGVAIAAVVAGGAVTARKVYNDRNFITLHHSTSKQNAASIRRSGFRKGHPDHGDQIFFSTKNQKEYGGHVIKFKMRKDDFRAYSQRDPLNGRMKGYDNFYTLGVQVANHYLRGGK